MKWLKMSSNAHVLGWALEFLDILLLKSIQVGCCSLLRRHFYCAFSTGTAIITICGIAESVGLRLGTLGPMEVPRVSKLEVSEVRAWKIVFNSAILETIPYIFCSFLCWKQQGKSVKCQEM